VTERKDLAAGGFSSWLRTTRLALAGRHVADVPCGGCTACCTSSYFIHIQPEESQTLARVPRKLLFPAPGQPKGTKVLGYSENGLCPMFIDGSCSIYADRPSTCRTYDCRVFAATGIPAGDAGKALINARVRRWFFDFSTETDRDRHSAVRAAIAFLKRHEDAFPSGFVPDNPTQLALLAIKVHAAFCAGQDEAGENGHPRTPGETARAVGEEFARFEAIAVAMQTSQASSLATKRPARGS
jgi:uncharacterized protein